MTLDNLEHLLATYFAPAIPIDEVLRKRHAKSMRILARKFFMWLTREKKFPRAFQASLRQPCITILNKPTTYLNNNKISRYRLLQVWEKKVY